MLFSSNYTITIGSAVLRFLLYFELMVFWDKESSQFFSREAFCEAQNAPE